MEERESDEPRGQVVEISPEAGQQVPEGTVVTLFFSDGPEQIPQVVGMRRQEAVKALEALNFVPEVVETAETTEPRGQVVGQTPEAGREAPEGSTVVIYVSSYEEPTETPSRRRQLRRRRRRRPRPRSCRRPRRRPPAGSGAQPSIGWA